MAQTYRMMLGTSGRQWEQLTVREDGTMMLYFHGTDRSVTQRVTLVEDGAWKGWLKSEGGSLYPGIESGKWQAVDCPAESAEIAESEQRTDTDVTEEVVAAKPQPTGQAAEPQAVVTNTDCTDCTDNHAEAEECESPITNEPIPNQQQMNPQTEVTESPITDESIPNQQQMNLQTEVTESPITNEPIPNQPRPRRQRKPRVERQEPLTIDHSPLTIDHSPLTVNHQTSSTLKAIGMVAAATVALFVIYETGLLIPLGLIGLATGGFLK